MITDSKFLDLVYDAATSYIPQDEINDFQKEKLDNLSYRWCNCHWCKTELRIEDEIVRHQWEGHAHREKNEIRISRTVFDPADEAQIPLTELIHTILHEIVHILFPEYDEDKTEEKTRQWLRKSIWSQGWLP